MELSDQIILWLEKHNPLLSMQRLDHLTPLTSFKEVKVFDCTDVLIIEGVDTLIPPLRGLKVLMIEDDLSKIAALLQQADFAPHENLFLSTRSKEQLYPILKQFVFKKIQYQGNLREVSSAMDEITMSFSEYRDLGEVILPNILGNLLHIHSYIDGRDLGELLTNEEAIICGNGLSLKRGISEIKQMKKRPIIFSVGSSLPVLLEEGIIPDFFAIIDPSPPKELYSCLKDISIPIFYQNRASKEILHLHQGTKIFMGSSRGWQIEDALIHELKRESFSFDAGWHAGNFGAHIALAMGCAKITLVGIDGVAKAGEAAPLEKEGKFTRSDLYYGMDFFTFLLENFPERTICHYTEGFSFKGALIVDKLEVKGKSCEIKLPKALEFEQQKVKSILHCYFDHSMLESCEELMSQKELNKLFSAALLAELSLEPLTQHFCLPIWEIWKNLLENSQDVLSKITFIYTLLKRFSAKTGKIGDAFYLFGKREGSYKRIDANGVVREQGAYFNGLAEGLFSTYTEKGKLLVTQEMSEGLRHGKYQVFDGKELVREGQFYEGLAHGRHLCYHREKIVDDIMYDRGNKCGVHKIYTDNGVKVEEIHYREGDFFDRTKYDENGSKVYSGIWKDGLFEEIGYQKGMELFRRLGKLVGKKLVFEGDHELIH